jgi:hypothetical protein
VPVGVEEVKKKNLDNQDAKYQHAERMLEMQVQRDKYACEQEKEKRVSKEESDKNSLKAKNAHTMLTHNLRKQTKDEDIVCREIAKKRKETEVSENVSTIAAGLRSRQMTINNGQFDNRPSLDTVSFCLRIV